MHAHVCVCVCVNVCVYTHIASVSDQQAPRIIATGVDALSAHSLYVVKKPIVHAPTGGRAQECKVCMCMCVCIVCIARLCGQKASGTCSHMW